MKKVIDANYFQDPELEEYLKSDKSNKVVWELSRAPGSSAQFVDLTCRHRDIEMQLARSRASLTMIPIWSPVASL